jgi:hypothetical protein
MFDKNILTFNPGWGSDAQQLSEFTDVRELQRRLLYPNFGSSEMSGDTQCNIDGILQPCTRALLHGIQVGAGLRVESVFGSIPNYTLVPVGEPGDTSDTPEDPDNPKNPVTINDHYHYELVYTDEVTGSIQTHQPQNTNYGPVTQEQIDRAHDAVEKNYDKCRNKYFGNSDTFGTRHIPGSEATVMTLAAGMNDAVCTCRRPKPVMLGQDNSTPIHGTSLRTLMSRLQSERLKRRR